MGKTYTGNGECGSVLTVLLRTVCWVVFIGGLAIVLDKTGPYQGWIARLAHGNAPSPSGTEEHAANINTDELFVPDASEPAFRGADRGNGNTTTSAPSSSPSPHREPRELTPLEREYRDIYEHVLARLPKPKIGESYTLHAKDGQTTHGTLTELSSGQVKLRTQYGEIALPLSAIADRDITQFFPKQAAKQRALVLLHKRHSPNPTKPDPATTSTSEAAPEKAPRTVQVESGSSRVRFNPRPEKSDESLKPLVEAFAHWLEVQHRRIGGKVADKAYAHKQSRATVLYLVLDPQFLAQPYDTQFQFAESLWQFWAFRCQDYGAVNSPNSAYIVLMDPNRRHFGGSKPTRGSDVFIRSNDTRTARGPK